MSNQPDPAFENIITGLSDSQVQMLLQVAHGQPVMPRNAAVRTGLVERCLVDVVYPPTDWKMTLTSLGQTIAELLPHNLAKRLYSNHAGLLIQLANNEPVDLSKPINGTLITNWIIRLYGLINQAEDGTLTITPQGRAVANWRMLSDAQMDADIQAHAAKQPEDAPQETPSSTPIDEDMGEMVRRLHAGVYDVPRQSVATPDAASTTATDDEDAPQAQSIARRLNSQERLILDELCRRKSMVLTENQALHRGNLNALGLIEVEGKSITITLLGEEVADAVNFLEITGEYNAEPTEPEPAVGTPNGASVVDNPAPSADHIAEPDNMVTPTPEEPATAVADPVGALHEEPEDDRAALLAEVEYLRKALIEKAEASNKESRSEIPRGSHKALKLHAEQIKIVRAHSDMMARRLERAEVELAALKAAQTHPASAPAEPAEVAKLKASIEELQKQVDRQTFNHKRQLDEKDEAAAKLRREIDTLTTERNEFKKEASSNAREFVAQANAAQELREQVETLKGIIERIKPATGSATQYRIARNTSEVELAKMHAAGWGFQHMQFMPDGALHVVFVHAPAPGQPTTQPPVYAAATTDTQEAEIVSDGEPVGTPNGASVTFTEPPTSPTPAPLNGFKVVIIDDAPGIPMPDATDPDGVKTMRQMMRSGVPADQISATLNQHNLDKASADFTNRQQQAAEFASNPPFNRPAPPPRRLITSTN